ncbi:MAG: sugar phosphate nucleotidyltransferase, partial [Schleiferiaceae bacterium]|nr:sugar phosphate nucleotidyltransferase [Schleiferiaceae bacterium]
MKAVIFAGGLGTRLSEETATRPKPMVEIGGKPILWHIMKMYSSHGVNDFIVCCGYKGFMIKEYFANYFLHMSDITFDMQDNDMTVHQQRAEPWKVTLVCQVRETLKGKRGVGPRLPYWLGMAIGYFADAVTAVKAKKLPLSSIRIKKFCSSTAFASAKHDLDSFEPPFTLQEGIDRTLYSEFISPDVSREIFFTE